LLIGSPRQLAKEEVLSDQSTFHCESAEACERIVNSLLGLSPTPTRIEFEREPTLGWLSELYEQEQGPAAVRELEIFLGRASELPYFSSYPTEDQLIKAVEQAYKSEANQALLHLLHAYELYFTSGQLVRSELLHGFAVTAGRELSSLSVVAFCSGCGELCDRGREDCRICGSPVFELRCAVLAEVVTKGIELHVPAEIFVSRQLRDAGFHLLKKTVGKEDYSLSLTFQAFGSKIDVDSVGVGHPACILFVDVTTSRIDQGKAALIRGGLDLLKRFASERDTSLPPVHFVLVSTTHVDLNVDSIASDRAGLSVLSEPDLPSLSNAFRKIPYRLTR
jgi:hypothetical protein